MFFRRSLRRNVMTWCKKGELGSKIKSRSISMLRSWHRKKMSLRRHEPVKHEFQLVVNCNVLCSYKIDETSFRVCVLILLAFAWISRDVYIRDIPVHPWRCNDGSLTWSRLIVASNEVSSNFATLADRRNEQWSENSWITYRYQGPEIAGSCRRKFHVGGISMWAATICRLNEPQLEMYPVTLIRFISIGYLVCIKWYWHVM